VQLVPESSIAASDVGVKALQQIAKLFSFFNPEPVAFFDCCSPDGDVSLGRCIHMDATINSRSKCAFDLFFVELHDSLLSVVVLLCRLAGSFLLQAAPGCKYDACATQGEADGLATE
jgi:hypothetical protein